jgi:3-oxoadipate enol-lactonase
MENSELLAARIPGARLEVFEGGHLFMIQDRSAFPAIIEFLRGES